MKAILILVMCLMVGSCKPLQKTQTTLHNNVIVVDSTITQVIKKELEKQLLEINTTVIEFEQNSNNEACISDIGNDSTNIGNLIANNGNYKIVIANDKPIEVTQPIKRIIKTELVQRIDKVVEIDSTERKQLNVIDKTETDIKTKEQPSNFVQGAKWVGVILVFILLILICFRFMR